MKKDDIDLGKIVCVLAGIFTLASYFIPSKEGEKMMRDLINEELDKRNL